LIQQGAVLDDGTNKIMINFEDTTPLKSFIDQHAITTTIFNQKRRFKEPINRKDKRLFFLMWQHFIGELAYIQHTKGRKTCMRISRQRQKS
jgi:hypothetical protein